MWREVFKELWSNKESRRSLVKAIAGILIFVLAIAFLITDKLMHPKHVYSSHPSRSAPFVIKKDILINDSFPTLTEIRSDTPGTESGKSNGKQQVTIRTKIISCQETKGFRF
ncbi:MAG: hypothetical protein JWO06_3556 [Bacteroidota bacterium]|nr:hypothetical protein [Bacteroidota bacterium]